MGAGMADTTVTTTTPETDERPLVPEWDDTPEPPAQARHRLRALVTRLGQVRLESWVTFTIVGACCVFVFAQLHPDLLFSNTTPAGGDMGAHVWGPAYLRDNLIPAGRLSGWTPDWYAGFPAYQFYMVVPSLMILLLDVVLPYGIAFKLVTVSGAIALPLCAWAFGRLARLPFPTPALFSVAAVLLLFDRSYSIYGGNIASTLAGEFAFTISFALAVLYLGVVARGLETGRYRGWAALLLALCGLCHLIPAFFAVAGTAVWWLLWTSRDLDRSGAARLIRQFSFVLAAAGAAIILITTLPLAVALILTGVLTAAGLALVVTQSNHPERWLAFWELSRKRLWWLATMAPVGAMLSAFWVLPFYGRSRYLNDMGWVKEVKYLDFLFFRDEVVGGGLKDVPELTWVIALALVGVLISLAFRQRAGLFLIIVAIGAAVAFRYAPQGRLWNTRLLPFYYLSLYLLAALAIGQLRLLLRSPPVRRWTLPGAAIVAVFMQTAIIRGWSWTPPYGSKAILFDGRFLPFVVVSIALMAAILAAEVATAPVDARRRSVVIALGSSLGVQLTMVARSSLQADDRLLPWFWAFLAIAVVGALVELVRADVAHRRQLSTVLVAVALVILVLALLGPDGWNSGTRLLPYFYAAVGLVSVSAVLELRDSLRAPVWSDPGEVGYEETDSRYDDSGNEDAETGDEYVEIETLPAVPPVSDRTLSRAALIIGAVVMSCAGLLVVALPLHVSPGELGTDQIYRLGPFSTSDASFVDGWAAWNYKGYEAACAPGEGNCTGGGNKPYFPEYEAIVRTMQRVGKEEGCGRAMWEYSSDLDSYGTPMALMLLPHWTDGCIGSMEGLYFEASTTTPYHFLNQDELSTQGSNAQRGLPYTPSTSQADFDLGVKHLQMFGVRYYLAFTPTMLEYAERNEDLTEIASSAQQCRNDLCPDGVEPGVRWVVYEVADAPLVAPLTNEPVVLTGIEKGHTCETVDLAEDPRGRECKGWLDPAVDWYQDESLWSVPLAESGPSDWERMPVEEWMDTHEAPATPVDPVEISDIDAGTETISFSVDQVGVPVVVKASYFPNWKVKGAKGPYRVTPNLMVVVPTEKDVKLYYGWTPLDIAAWMLTLGGIVAVIILFRRRPLVIPSPDEALETATARVGPRTPATEDAAPTDVDEPGPAPPPTDE